MSDRRFNKVQQDTKGRTDRGQQPKHFNDNKSVRNQSNSRIETSNLKNSSIQPEIEMTAEQYLKGASDADLVRLSSQAIGFKEDQLPSEPNDRAEPRKRGGAKAAIQERKKQQLNTLGLQLGQAMAGRQGDLDLKPRDRTTRTRAQDGESFAPDAYDDEEDIDIGLNMENDEDPFYDQKINQQIRSGAPKPYYARSVSQQVPANLRKSSRSQYEEKNDMWDEIGLDASGLSQKKLIDDQSFASGKQRLNKTAKTNKVKPSRANGDYGNYFDEDAEVRKDRGQILPYNENISISDLALGPNEFSADPYQRFGKKSTYINMIVCHALAQNDELTYNKFIRKMTAALAEDQSDKVAKRLLSVINSYKGKQRNREVSFGEIRNLVAIKQMRLCMNDAVAFSIETKREIIAFDIVTFSREQRFSIVIADKEIQLLIKNQSYELIEDLVQANSLLLIDYSQLDAMEKIGHILANDRHAAQARREATSIIHEDQEGEDEGDNGEKAPHGANMVQEEDMMMEGGGGITTSPHKLKRNGTNTNDSSTRQSAAAAPQGENANLYNADRLIEEADRNLAELRQVAEGTHPAVQQKDSQPFRSSESTPVYKVAEQIQENEQVRLEVQKHTETPSRAKPQLKSQVLPDTEYGKKPAHMKSSTVPRLSLEQAELERARQAELSSQRIVSNTRDARKPPLMRNVTHKNLDKTIAQEGGETLLDLDRVEADLNMSEFGNGKIHDRESVSHSDLVNPPSNGSESFFVEKKGYLKKPPQILTNNGTDDQTRAGSTKMSTKSRQKNSAPSTSKNGDKPKLVEKFLKISDFTEYILDNRDVFMEQDLEGIKTTEESEGVVREFLNNFLRNVQDMIDFDRTVSVLIDNRVHNLLIEDLFEQTGDALKENAEEEIDKSMGARERRKSLTEEQAAIYRRFARTKLLVQLINQSVLKKEYDIAYEVVKRFLSDLLKAKELPIFDQLFTQFQEDTTRYEAKIALVLKYMPLINRKQAFRLMKIFGEVINEPAHKSVLRNNVNPLRVGLMLYRLIEELTENFQFSEGTATEMKDTLAGQLVNMLNMYNDPVEVLSLAELTDYEGNDMFWYLDEFDLYSLLDSRIMDRIIQKKWNGKYDINAQMLDYSTSYTMLADIYKLFATDRVFQEINHEMCSLDKRDKVHQFKYNVWKYSMYLRGMVDLVFLIGITVFFQIGIAQYTHIFEVARKRADDMYNKKAYDASQVYATNSELYKDRLSLDNNFSDLTSQLRLTTYASFINLLFPINFLMETVLVFKTKRKPGELGVDFFNELVLFVMTLLIMLSLYRDFQVEDPANKLMHSSMSADERIGAAIIWAKISGNGSTFEYLLAFLSGNTFFKLIIRMLLTETFGPNFKVIVAMGGELAKFYVLWTIVLFLFTSVGLILFSELGGNWSSIAHAFFLMFDYSLGNWDSSIYCNDGLETTMCFTGKIYIFVFLSINMVLLLNLVIAILSTIYAFYEDKSRGLYYEVLVGKFSTMEYDHMYGAAACAQPPLNLMILPFWWITIFPCFSDEFHVVYNEFLCQLLYAPLALLFTLLFTIANVVTVPFAYVGHLYSLIRTLTDADETMDELEEKLERAFTIVKFFFFAPFILVVSIPVDSFVFAYNLYTDPEEDEHDDLPIFSQESLLKFDGCLTQALTDRRNQTGRRHGTDVNFIQLNLLLQKELDIMSQIMNLLFANDTADKFVLDPVTGRQKLAPTHLKGIQEFNQLKNLVANAADSENNVDTELLRSLVDQVNMRSKMLEIERRVSDLELGKTSDEIFNNCLYELARTNPKGVEAELAEEGQRLDQLEEKIVGIKEEISKMVEAFSEKFDKLQESVEVMGRAESRDGIQRAGFTLNSSPKAQSLAQIVKDEAKAERLQKALNEVNKLLSGQ